jgi:cytidylate kinase
MGEITIAIDGYSSTGKSTIARKVAEELGYIYIDTGAMYRCVTLYALRKGWLGPGDRVDSDRIVSDLDRMQIEFRTVAGTSPESGRISRIYLNGEDVSIEIRTMEVSGYVSQVAAIPEVRRHLVAQQQRMGQNKGIVMDGRDIGTAVFPEAELKIFLTASVDVRARRRFDELKNRGESVTLQTVTENLRQRDYIDSNRETDPLRQASDAICFDNSDWTVERQFLEIIELARKRIAASV